MGIREDWKRIADFARAEFPKGAFRLARGATKRQVDDLEKRLGLYLPEDLRESYRVHNGSLGTRFAYIGRLLTLDQIGETWAMLSDWQRENNWGLEPAEEIKGPIKPVWWNPLRIRVTDDDAGDGLTIDLDPSKGGHRGQVIHFDHEQGPLCVYAPSWGALLKQIADDAEAGKYVYEQGYNWRHVERVDW